MTLLMVLSFLLLQIPDNSVPPVEPNEDPVETVQSVRESSPEGSRALEEDEGEPVIVLKKSPTGALLRSALLPGWGQFYNREPLKGVILGTVELGLLAWLVREHIVAEDARQDYLVSGDPADESRYETHRQRRIDLIWYTSAAWLYGMFDAYVDAYLFSFEGENRSFERETGLGVIFYFNF